MSLKDTDNLISRSLLTICLTLLMACLVSCGDDDDDNNNNDDDSGMEPESGFITFLLDGEEVMIRNVITNLGSNQDIGGSGMGEFFTLFGADEAGEGDFSIGIIDEGEIEERSYEFIDADFQGEIEAGAIFNFFPATTDPDIMVFYSSTINSTGNVVITTFDRENETISGTFSGTITRTETDLLGNILTTEDAEITNGSINLVSFAR